MSVMRACNSCWLKHPERVQWLTLRTVFFNIWCTPDCYCILYSRMCQMCQMVSLNVVNLPPESVGPYDSICCVMAEMYPLVEFWQHCFHRRNYPLSCIYTVSLRVHVLLPCYTGSEWIECFCFVQMYYMCERATQDNVQIMHLCCISVVLIWKLKATTLSLLFVAFVCIEVPNKKIIKCDEVWYSVVVLNNFLIECTQPSLYHDICCYHAIKFHMLWQKFLAISHTPTAKSGYAFAEWWVILWKKPVGWVSNLNCWLLAHTCPPYGVQKLCSSQLEVKNKMKKYHHTNTFSKSYILDARVKLIQHLTQCVVKCQRNHTPNRGGHK